MNRIPEDNSFRNNVSNENTANSRNSDENLQNVDTECKDAEERNSLSEIDSPSHEVLKEFDSEQSKCIIVLQNSAGDVQGYDLDVARDVLSGDPDLFLNNAHEIAYIENGRIIKATKELIQERLSRLCDVKKVTKNKKGETTEAPRRDGYKDLSLLLATNPVPVNNLAGWRIVKQLSSTPLLTEDGEIEYGFHEPSGTLVHGAMQIPEKSASLQSAADSRDKLLSLIDEFEFDGDEEQKAIAKSAWLAAIFTILVRHLIKGPVPGWLIDADGGSGVGKTLIAKVPIAIATGNDSYPPVAPDLSNEQIERELRYLLTDPVVWIDNCIEDIGKSIIASAMTQDTFRCKMFYNQNSVTVLVRSVWFFAGNNITVSNDLHRRLLRIKLAVTQERPDQRTGPRPGETWKIPRLWEYVKENLAELQACALDCIRAYLKAELPQPEEPLLPTGSFDNWSSIIAGCLVWLGLPDPWKANERVKELDKENDNIEIVFGVLKESLNYYKRAVRCTDILSLMQDSDNKPNELFKNILMFKNAYKYLPLDSRRIGMCLKSMNGKSFNGYVIAKATTKNGYNFWTLKKLNIK